MLNPFYDGNRFNGNFQKEGVASFFFPWVFINYHTQTWIISTFINCMATNLKSLHLLHLQLKKIKIWFQILWGNVWWFKKLTNAHYRLKQSGYERNPDLNQFMMTATNFTTTLSLNMLSDLKKYPSSIIIFYLPL